MKVLSQIVDQNGGILTVCPAKSTVGSDRLDGFFGV
jgi:hypothetical protein